MRPHHRDDGFEESRPATEPQAFDDEPGEPKG
jgi:putative (di)nucleoside polyphosphate hydrolase